MSDIDDKLREIAAKLYNHDFFMTDKTPNSPLLSHGDESVNSAMAEIKAAFAESGYVPLLNVKDGDYILINGSEFRLNGDGTMTEVKRMTGQEWYDRFEKEIAAITNVDVSNFAYMSAAKRAAGLE